jgi:hypothetical protein
LPFDPGNPDPEDTLQNEIIAKFVCHSEHVACTVVQYNGMSEINRNEFTCEEARQPIEIRGIDKVFLNSFD